MCLNHYVAFRHYQFYIRWVPKIRRFVFINHARAVRLFPDGERVPFHGAFLDHEMRVRGSWPYLPDRLISLPIMWQEWIADAPGDGGDDDYEDENEEERKGNDSNLIVEAGQPGFDSYDSKHQCLDSTIIFKDPIANPLEFEAIMVSARQQPNWKATQIEGQSWEGTAEENVYKYLRIMHPSSA